MAAKKPAAPFKKASSRERIEQLVEEAIVGIERRLQDKTAPPTIADYLKVMQLKKDIESTEEDPKEIKVTWVEPGAANSEE